MANANARSDALPDSRPSVRQSAVAVTIKQADLILRSYGEGPDEAGMNPDIHEATSALQDAGDLTHDSCPVGDVGVDQRSDCSVDAVALEGQPEPIGNGDRQLILGVTQLTYGDVEANWVPTQSSDGLGVDACAAPDVDAAALPSAEQFGQSLGRARGVNPRLPLEITGIPVGLLVIPRVERHGRHAARRQSLARAEAFCPGRRSRLATREEGAQLKDYEAKTYGESWADIYDDWAAERFPENVTDAAVSALLDLDTNGKALELGVGTGRIALPLAQRGLEVHGIDASESMLTKLSGKPGGDAVTATLGDFADFTVGGGFGLIFVVFNTLFVLPTQEQQLSCLRCVARHLDDDGVFVIEAFVPDPTRFESGQTFRALRVDTEQVHLEASRHDPVAQTIVSQHITVSHNGIQLRPVNIRYVWPSELDLMARLAGLELRNRWGGWDRSAFDESSRTHVSVFGHAR